MMMIHLKVNFNTYVPTYLFDVSLLGIKVAEKEAKKSILLRIFVALTCFYNTRNFSQFFIKPWGLFRKLACLNEIQYYEYLKYLRQSSLKFINIGDDKKLRKYTTGSGALEMCDLMTHVLSLFIFATLPATTTTAAQTNSNGNNV